VTFEGGTVVLLRQAKAEKLEKLFFKVENEVFGSGLRVEDGEVLKKKLVNILVFLAFGSQLVNQFAEEISNADTVEVFSEVGEVVDGFGFGDDVYGFGFGDLEFDLGEKLEMAFFPGGEFADTFGNQLEFALMFSKDSQQPICFGKVKALENNRFGFVRAVH
jgi:hypothetical protein